MFRRLPPALLRSQLRPERKRKAPTNFQDDQAREIHEREQCAARKRQSGRPSPQRPPRSSAEAQRLARIDRQNAARWNALRKDVNTAVTRSQYGFTRRKQREQGRIDAPEARR